MRKEYGYISLSLQNFFIMAQLFKIIKMKNMLFHKVWGFLSTLLKHTGAFIVGGQIMIIIWLNLPNICHGYQCSHSKSEIWHSFFLLSFFKFVLEWLLQFLFGCLKPKSAMWLWFHGHCWAMYSVWCAYLSTLEHCLQVF